MTASSGVRSGPPPASGGHGQPPALADARALPGAGGRGARVVRSPPPQLPHQRSEAVLLRTFGIFSRYKSSVLIVENVRGAEQREKQKPLQGTVPGRPRPGVPLPTREVPLVRSTTSQGLGLGSGKSRPSAVSEWCRPSCFVPTSPPACPLLWSWGPGPGSCTGGTPRASERACGGQRWENSCRKASPPVGHLRLCPPPAGPLS